MRNNFYHSVIFLGWAAILNSCSTVRENPQLKLISEQEYISTVERHTQKTKVYDGFVNILDFGATLHTADMAAAQVDQNARLYQWSVDQYKAEKSRVESELASQTKIFLSFFVPERKHDDLHRSNSKWKIFLDANGKRFEGKATRMKAILAEVQSLYPFHTRWGTPYFVTFQVPVSVIETGKAKLTLTGPVTAATVQF